MTFSRVSTIAVFVSIPTLVAAQQGNPAPCKVGDRYIARGLQGQVRAVWDDQIRVQPDGAEAYDQVIVPLPLGSGHYVWPKPSAPAYGTAKPTPRPTPESVAPDPGAKCETESTEQKVARQLAPAAVALGSGVALLTPDALKSALSATETELATASSPELAKIAAANAQGRYTYLPKDPPFNVTILTPWARAAMTALEAKRKYEPAPQLSADALNRLGLSIEVFPGSSMTTADAIENVVIKRGENIIRPIERKVEPRTIQNALGAKRELSMGTFRFEMDALAPTADVTIVLIGSRGNYEITLTPAELSHLR